MTSIFKKWENGCALLTDAGWGDSGKGKCASALIPDISAKIIGGHNAGHTVVTDKYSIGLGLIPSTVIYPQTVNVIGQEVVINPFFLINEIKSLRKIGIILNESNLLIDLNSHIILPWHEIRDALSEESRGKAAIGSLHLGVGWAYSDRVNRRGLRIEDLVTNNWKERILNELKIQNGVIESMKEDVLRNTGKKSEIKTHIEKEKLITSLSKVRNILKRHATNTVSYIWNAIEKEKKILFEDSHGAMLEISHGSWPYTTGVNTALGAVHRSFGGKAIKSINKTIISIKSYQTRVGGGPLPTEDTQELGKFLQEKGGEFGTRSGRARRCGPIDLPALKYGINIIGAQEKDEIALTKLDVLTGLEELPICIAYSYKGKVIKTPPTMNAEYISKVEPIYKIFNGWKKDISTIKSFRYLPKEAINYVKYIENSLQIPITMIGTGKNKDSVILK